jgi:anaerobic magnesium-protoporphyrin IX monomethyl ester cyclase
MKALLINPPVSEQHNLNIRLFPLGLGYVANSLDKAGIDVAILDIWIDQLGWDETVSALQSALPGCDFVGVTGIINGFKYLRKLIRAIKDIRPAVPIILGGSITPPNPLLLLQHMPADYLCLGEGETTILDFCHAVAGDLAPEDIPGLAFMRGQHVHLTKARPLQADLSQYDFPLWEKFPIAKYIQAPMIVPGSKRSLNLIGSRGCPYHCVFCSPNFGRQIRLRGIPAVVHELEMLKNAYGIDHFEMSDELFFVDEKRAFDFSQALISRGLGLTWRGLGRVNLFHRFHDETFVALKNSGCHWIGFGMESGSPKLLTAMHKGITLEQIEAVIAKMRKAKIKFGGNFIFGFPGEDRQTIRDTIEFCKKNLIPLGKFTYCCPLPGTVLYQQCLANGRIADEVAFWEAIDATLFDFVINLTDFSDSEFVQLKTNAELEIQDWNRTHGSASFWE